MTNPLCTYPKLCHGPCGDWILVGSSGGGMLTDGKGNWKHIQCNKAFGLPSAILLPRLTGNVAHIDFEVCRETGMALEEIVRVPGVTIQKLIDTGLTFSDIENMCRAQNNMHHVITLLTSVGLRLGHLKILYGYATSAPAPMRWWTSTWLGTQLTQREWKLLGVTDNGLRSLEMQAYEWNELAAVKPSY